MSEKEKKLSIGNIIACIALVAIIIFVIAGASTWSSYKKAVSMEAQYTAQLQANKSNHSSMWTKVKQLTQVTDKQAEQFKDVYTDLIAGRNQDTNLLFKAIQEQNPQLDPGVYEKLSDEIVAGRNAFDMNQQSLADKASRYNTFLKSHPIMSSITGRQPIDASKDIIIVESTIDAYNFGIEKDIDIK